MLCESNRKWRGEGVDGWWCVVCVCGEGVVLGAARQADGDGAAARERGGRRGGVAARGRAACSCSRRRGRGASE